MPKSKIEEDLEKLLIMSNGERVEDDIDEDFDEKLETEEFIEIDNFIDKSVKIKTGVKLDPKARLVDFANIEIFAIDPRIKVEIEDSLNRSKENLMKLKSLFRNF